ncbi:hypothetical protein M8C21_025260 [Ambrosia artemisiifolia]|uniref:Uncharacterized protein n=1 Tax=Ambrosia artemisiifolia TaxID=4212 RepID=A0AAD5G7U5_AMBAR|nr:hypothetical protein M8C21_025260 [Ambrosia artemisiifolia]
MDGDILVSNGENFALGFFSPPNSTNRYVGIWYNKVSEQTVVWVANRDRPITNSSGILSVDQTGNLILHEKDQNFVFWSTNVSRVVKDVVSAQLLDSGNLVLFQGLNKEVYSWQSFDYPSNTVLPGMKIGIDKKTGLNRVFTSWKSSVNPGVGDYSHKMELVGSPQLFLFQGMTKIWRTGSWRGNGWTGIPNINSNYLFNVNYIDNNDEAAIVFYVRDLSIISRLVVTESRTIDRLAWHEADHKDGSKGCKKKGETQLCEVGDGFVEMASIKVPDTSTAHVNMSMGLKACKGFCLRDCSCMGYASADITKDAEDGGCITWHKDMFDMRMFSDGGQSFYIRVDAAELGKRNEDKVGFSSTNTLKTLERTFTEKDIGKNVDLDVFDLSEIVAATDNFSLSNKLGEGGFGSVYKVVSGQSWQ